jgi:peroxiredoxin Q/BCP
MKKIGILALGLFAGSIMAQKSVQVGDTLPSFSLKNQHGETVELSKYAGKKKVVYFYPKDDTPGCTTQACSFRDAYQDFEDLGAVVIGISADDVASHKKFAEKYKLSFDLLADEKNELRKLFGVPKTMGMIPGRVTYVTDADNKVVFMFNQMSDTKDHITKTLAFLKENKQ